VTRLARGKTFQFEPRGMLDDQGNGPCGNLSTGSVSWSTSQSALTRDAR